MIGPSALWLTLLDAWCTARGQTPGAPVKAVSISGTVTDAAGGPAAYEAVYLRLAGSRGVPRDVVATAPTDGAGKFVFMALQPATYELRATVPRFIEARQDIDASGGSVGDVALELRVAPCDCVPIRQRRLNLNFLHHPKRTRVSISGRVVNALGAAVENATVGSSLLAYGHDAKTGRDGSFQLRGEFRGRYTPVPGVSEAVRVKGPGLFPVWQTISVRSGKNINIDVGAVVVKQWIDVVGKGSGPANSP
jgi:hypothetical protein